MTDEEWGRGAGKGPSPQLEGVGPTVSASLSSPRATTTRGADDPAARKSGAQPRDQPWMDHYRAPLPPCTLESLPEPIDLQQDDDDDNDDENKIARSFDDDNDDDEGRRRSGRRRRRRQVWPVLLGCYRLVDDATSSEGGGPQSQQRRSGQLDLLTLPVPDVTSNDPSLPLRFGTATTTVLDPSTSSGILDCKWKPRGEGSFVSFDARRHRSGHLFATAHATGEVRIHALHVRSRTDEQEDEQVGGGGGGGDARGAPFAKSGSLLDAQANGAVAESPSHGGFPSARHQDSSCPALCLSLNWRLPPPPPPPPHSQPPELSSSMSSSQIVSTYSDGRVAIHDVVVAARGSFNGNDDHPSTTTSCHVLTRDCWSAHSMFTSPSEVWTAAFVGSRGHPNDDHGGGGTTTPTPPPCVATGGDDATLKLWDVRAPSRPTTVLANHFGAGVTCVSPHPRFEHLFAAGSYDESVNLYDVRQLSSKTPLSRTEGLGGGVWRLQWHPVNDRRLLVAAMHGGCLVTQYKGLVPKSSSSTTSPSRITAPFMRPQPDPSSLLYPSLAFCPTASFDSTLTDTSGVTAASGGVGSSNASAGKIRLRVKKAFEEHRSMVYGATWLVCRHPTQLGSYFEAAASCSFYDQNVYVWDSVF